MTSTAPMTPLECISICTTMSFLFVSCLYTLVPKRVKSLPRDHEDVVFHRGFALVLTVSLCFAWSWWYLEGAVLGMDSLRVLTSWRLIARPLVSFMVLFSGPLIQFSLIPCSTGFNYFEDEMWVNLRNLFLAPISEEIMFRSIMGSFMKLTFNATVVRFATPGFFALAHVHHGVFDMKFGNSTVKQAVVKVLVQSAYTWVFGSMMMTCLLKTKSVMPVIAVHSFCNFMGLPRVQELYSIEYDGSPYLQARKFLVGVSYVIGIYLFCTFDFY